LVVADATRAIACILGRVGAWWRCSDDRAVALVSFWGMGEESPGFTEIRCRVTPGRSDPTESATENKPPPSGGKGETVG